MGTGKAFVFYLMGPSGSGKDSLLTALRPNLHEASVVCAHRYITRQVMGNEQHVPLSADEFSFRKQSGLFAMDWEANGYQYAIGIEIRQMLERGVSVIMNGSRAFFQEACALFPDQLIPVLITVPETIVKERLLARNRETMTEIEARLARNRSWHKDIEQQLTGMACSRVIEVDNSGAIELVARALYQDVQNCIGMMNKSFKDENPLQVVMALYDNWGNRNYGERISQLSHALQAAELAREAGLSEELILAAFLHDIGHFLVLERHPDYCDDGKLRHDMAGAAFLKSLGFSKGVTEPVAAHVQAKRYLCRIDQDYYSGLSDASRHSLEFQGGSMSVEEAEIFAARSDLDDILQLRQFDEQAKDTEFQPGNIDWVYQLMARHLQTTAFP